MWERIKKVFVELEWRVGCFLGILCVIYLIFELVAPEAASQLDNWIFGALQLID